MDETTRHVSPDGRYAVMLVPEEMRMSHWVESPVIVTAADNAVLLDLSASLWSADAVRWSSDSTHVALDLRRYPGDVPGVTVEVYPEAEIAFVPGPAGSESMPLSQLLPWLEAYYARHHR